MTDTEIIKALIHRDSKVTLDFFFRQCRPLFTSVIRRILGSAADYDECINELYLYRFAIMQVLIEDIESDNSK